MLSKKKKLESGSPSRFYRLARKMQYMSIWTIGAISFLEKVT